MRLILSIAVVSLMLSAPKTGAHPQRDGVVIVDGLNQEWGPSGMSPYNSVQPNQVDAIDLRHIDYFFGSIYPSVDEFWEHYTATEMYPNEHGHFITVHYPKADWQFAIAFDVQGSLFAGEQESSYELFFDVYPERDHGEVIGPWHTFRPDYRFAFTGRNGRMERERYQVWNGTQWVGEPVTDAPKVQAAAGDNFFECLIPWSSLGNPLTRSESAPEEYDLFLLFALCAHQGENQDFIPNPVFSQNWPDTGALGIGNSQAFYETGTVIDPRSWGQLKARQNRD